MQGGFFSGDELFFIGNCTCDLLSPFYFMEDINRLKKVINVQFQTALPNGYDANASALTCLILFYFFSSPACKERRTIYRPSLCCQRDGCIF